MVDMDSVAGMAIFFFRSSCACTSESRNNLKPGKWDAVGCQGFMWCYTTFPAEFFTKDMLSELEHETVGLQQRDRLKTTDPILYPFS